MNRPERLRQPIEVDLFERLFPWMACREAPVIGRMPILRRDDEGESRLEAVHDWDHLITVRDAQSPAGQKIVLQINQKQDLHSFRSQRVSEFSLRAGSKMRNCPAKSGAPNRS